jgi:hypothetical protein
MSDQTDIGVLLSKIALDVSDLKKGLRESREDMQSFKTMAQGVGESVRKAFAFGGITVGIYELVSALRDFAKEAALTGARTETLEIAMNKIGETYGVSRESLKYYVNELKAAGITTQESMLAVSKFLTSGLPLEKLKELATRARDIGVVADVNTSEALGRMVQGVVSGEVEILRRLMIQIPNTDDIYKRYAATLGTTADQLNQVQKRQAVLNEVLLASAGFAGVAAEADSSVGKQMASMTRFAEEARNSLWALFGPVMLEAVQELTRGWKELKAWADANKASLQGWGESIADWIRQKLELIAIIGKFIAQNRELILVVLQFLVFYKAAGWIVAFATALQGAQATMVAATTTAKGLQATLLALTGNPWVIAIALVLTGLAAVKKLQEKAPETAPLALAGEAWGVMTPEQQNDLVKSGEALQKPPPPAPKPEVKPASPEEAARQARAALEKALREAPKPTGKAGSGGKETADNLLAPTLAMYKAKREVELQDAQNSLDLLKSTNEKKKAELERALAAQEIDGQTYYRRLQELQQQETAAALAMIDRKRQAQQKAYQDSLTELAADEKLSPEAKNIAQQRLQAENRKNLAKLDTEAAQLRLDGEKKVTEELKRQVELKQQYQQKTEDLQLETAQLLGAISDQEGKLQRLYLDWQRAKQEAIKAGASPEYLQALDQNYQAKRLDTQYGGFASSISQGISSLVSTVMSGGQDLLKAAGSIFKGLFDEALKPGLEQLKNLLTTGFKDLFGESAAGLSSSIMGAIGLVGMLLTTGGSSSWSSSGVTSSVTAHEAVRGIIAGDTSLPIAEIGVSLKDALVETNGILLDIEYNTRNTRGPQLNITIEGLQESIRDALDHYFDSMLQLGKA